MINRHLGNADVVEWQTRYFEGVVSVCSCEFKSHRQMCIRDRHQVMERMLKTDVHAFMASIYEREDD